MVKRTTEIKENITEDDVRMKVKELSSPMLQSEYLENVLKRIVIQPNVKILASKMLSDLYVARGLWSIAAKTLENAADAAQTFSDKKNLYMSVGVLYIKSMDYLLADDAFRKAIEAASPGEKARLAADLRNLFMREADQLNNDRKIAKAAKLYERILKTATDINEKKKVMSNLVVLYEKLARISDSMQMRDSLKRL